MHRAAELADEVGRPGAFCRDVIEEKLDHGIVSGMDQSRGPDAAGSKTKPAQYARRRENHRGEASDLVCPWGPFGAVAAQNCRCMPRCPDDAAHDAGSSGPDPA